MNCLGVAYNWESLNMHRELFSAYLLLLSADSKMQSPLTLGQSSQLHMVKELVTNTLRQHYSRVCMKSQRRGRTPLRGIENANCKRLVGIYNQASSKELALSHPSMLMRPVTNWSCS